MSARIETKGQDNWRYRQGYQHVMRVPGPIMPMDFGRSGGLLRFASSLFQSRP